MHSIVFNLEPKLGYQIEDFVRKLNNFYKSVVTTLLGEVMKKCINSSIDQNNQLMVSKISDTIKKEFVYKKQKVTLE